MTRQQKEWIDSHPEYSIVGLKAGFASYSGTLSLRPDGSTIKRVRGQVSEPGAFDVAKLDTDGARGGVDPRLNMNLIIPVR